MSQTVQRSMGLSRTADGRTVPSAQRRLAPIVQQESALVGWGVSLAVTALAGFLRLWHLGTPNAFAFDETYYAKDAWSMWVNGYTTGYVDNANQLIIDGKTQGLFTDGPSMIVHPMVGKYLIGFSEWVFGMNPFGWRFASAVVGTLMVLVMVRLVRRLTGSMVVAATGGLLLCFDGLQFVLSRLALLDIFVAFFALLAVHFLVMDRDWSRARLAAAVPIGQRASGWGPRLWWRPWRLAAGVAFGLAVGSKWSAVALIAAFGLLVVFWDSGARRALGVRSAFIKTAIIDGIPAFGYLVVVAVLVYIATWTGWLMHASEYEQHLSNTQYTPYWGSYLDQNTHGFFPELWRSLRDLWHYHEAVWGFHTNGLKDATHVYQSNPWGWPVLNRPVGVAADLDIQPGVEGCTAAAGDTCLRQVLLLGTPVLWWAGVPALLYSAYAWIARRDWRFGIAIVGFVAGWLPWFRYDDRPIFSFYAIVMLPFTVLALSLVIGRLIGPAHATDTRRAWGVAIAGAFVVLVVANFAWFWPIYTDQLITHQDWLKRIWFRAWI